MDGDTYELEALHPTLPRSILTSCPFVQGTDESGKREA